MTEQEKLEQSKKQIEKQQMEDNRDDIFIDKSTGKINLID